MKSDDNSESPGACELKGLGGAGVADVERESNTDGRRRRRVLRIALLPLKLLLGVALRMLLTSVVFIVCAALAMRMMGYELPGASDLEKYFEGLEQLSDVLS